MPQDFRDPAGTAKRIETRLLIRNAGSWHGFSYRWNETETDATLLEDSDTQAFSLVDESGATFDYDWYYPRRTECFRCHTDVTNNVLGLNTAQMNADYTYPASGVTDNQLRAFEHIGLFAGGLPGEPCALPRAPDPTDETEPLAARALAYLQANCAMCHQPRGPTPTSIDLRWGTRLEARKVFDVYPERFDLGLPEPRILSPGDPDNSVLVARMETLDFHRMPPLASSRVDAEGIALIRSWITEQSEIDGNMNAFHSADTSADYRVDLSELLRVIQFYNSGGFGCDLMGEDGYGVGATGQRCTPHSADYAPTDWMLSMSEVLRVIQFYNMGGYKGALFSEAEDGYLPWSPCVD
jgi:hypothetical protein